MTTSVHADEPIPQHEAGSFRELWRVALPLILSSGSISLLLVVDRVFLTWYSKQALGASLPAGTLHWMLMSIALGTALYVNTFVAQYEGAGRKDRVAASIWQGIYLSLLSGVFYVFVIAFAGTLVSWMGHNAGLQKLETEYFSILCYGAVPTTLANVLSCFFSGRGRTTTVMCVNFAMVGINVVLDYGLIFGAWGLPEMGIRGAALATVLSELAAAGIYTGILMQSRDARAYHLWRHRRFDRALFGRLLRYGLPSGMQWFIEIGAFSVFTMLLGRIGETELTASSLAFNLNALSFVPLMGLGTAVLTLVAKRIGEQRPQLAVRTTWMAFGLTAGYMLVFAAIYLFLPDVILYAYSAYAPREEFETLRPHVVSLLRFVALYSFFDGMAVVFGSAVRGAGDTRFSLIFSSLAGWVIMVIPTALSMHYTGGDLTTSWLACSGYVIVIGIGFVLRFQLGPWKSMRVIESAAALATEKSDIEIAAAPSTGDGTASDKSLPEQIPLAADAEAV